jgi:hypothetical protein
MGKKPINSTMRQMFNGDLNNCRLDSPFLTFFNASGNLHGFKRW